MDRSRVGASLISSDGRGTGTKPIAIGAVSRLVGRGTRSNREIHPLACDCDHPFSHAIKPTRCLPRSVPTVLAGTEITVKTLLKQVGVKPIANMNRGNT